MEISFELNTNLSVPSPATSASDDDQEIRSPGMARLPSTSARSVSLPITAGIPAGMTMASSVEDALRHADDTAGDQAR